MGSTVYRPLSRPTTHWTEWVVKSENLSSGQHGTESFHAVAHGQASTFYPELVIIEGLNDIVTKQIDKEQCTYLVSFEAIFGWPQHLPERNRFPKLPDQSYLDHRISAAASLVRFEIIHTPGKSLNTQVSGNFAAVSDERCWSLNNSHLFYLNYL